MSDTTLDLQVNMNDDERRRNKRKRAAARFFVTVVAVIQHVYCRRRIREIDDFNEDEAQIRVRKHMLRDIYQGSNLHCYDSLRLTKQSFSGLCAILRERCGLSDTFYVSVEESVTLFLLVVSHGMKYRLIRSTYRWTLETVSRHFNEVLGAILSLSHEFIKLPDPSTEQPEDVRWKWFQDGLGALDGTHIEVRVSVLKQGRYRNRKQKVTTNVLGVCDRNMKFLYVLAGWEGSASDSRVLRDAMTRQDAFVVPSGKYYLVDAGYTNGRGFLAPYRSVRYHLKEWAASGNNPRTPRELYNLRHASARNVIERTFGLLKMRWAILRSSSFFGIRNQIHVINACCILHNFLSDRQREMDDIMLNDVDNEINNAIIEDQEEPNMIRHVQSSNEWNNYRDSLANQMWADYQARRAQVDMDVGKKGRGYVVWTDQMDEAPLNVFVEHYNKGDRAQNGWKPHVYTAAIKNVREKCSVDITKENIISRSKTFDKHYAIISKMLSRSGFGWDWDHNKLSIDGEDVWNNYVKENKEAACYRHKVIKFWDAISLVYSKDHATGVGARTAAESAAEMVAEDVNNGKNLDSAATSSTQTGEDHKKKRYRSDDSIACMLGEKLDTFTAAFQADVSPPAPKTASPEEILAALNEIPGLEEDDLLEAYDILISNDRKFKSLMALSERLKKKWILKQINT